MAESKKSVFDLLNSINVNDRVEGKESGKDKYGNPIKLSYLSWTWAWAEVKKRYPDANYEIEKFNGIPYAYDPLTGYMVYTKVTIEGITHEMWLPVMDGQNRAMKSEPYEIQTKYKTLTVAPATMFDVNKTIMRCLTKNLAMFGLGLYIYAGEDLPETEDEKVEAPVAKTTTKKVAPTPKAPAPVAKATPAPVAKATPAPVAKATPAPVAKTEAPKQNTAVERFPTRNAVIKICKKYEIPLQTVCDMFGLSRQSKDEDFKDCLAILMEENGVKDIAELN
jgi:hypothetical protein